VTFIAFGLVRATLFGFLERRPERDPLRDEVEHDEVGEGGGERRMFSLPLRGRRRGPGRREAP
jgi:hypothetical protein